MYEAIYRPAFAEGRLPGGYHAGVWHHSGDVENFSNGDPHSDNHGFYLLGEQMIWNESNDPEDDQGLAVFGQVGWAPEEWNFVSEYYGGGLLYKGPLKNRDHDYVGIGVAHAVFSSAILSPNVLQVQSLYRGRIHDFLRPQAIGGGNLDETAIELFYLMEVTPWMQVQPDLQYIANPNGTERDALAVGLRFMMTL